MDIAMYLHATLISTAENHGTKNPEVITVLRKIADLIPENLRCSKRLVDRVYAAALDIASKTKIDEHRSEAILNVAANAVTIATADKLSNRQST